MGESGFLLRWSIENPLLPSYRLINSCSELTQLQDWVVMPCHKVHVATRNVVREFLKKIQSIFSQELSTSTEGGYYDTENQGKKQGEEINN